MKQFNFKQGDAAWDNHRANARNASEASAILGCHPQITRTQLLHERFTGVPRQHSRFMEERVFAGGHAIEANLLPVAEAITGEDLYPVVGSECLSDDALSTDAGIELSASFDGRTLMGAVSWECKSLNEELRAALPHSGDDSAEHNDAGNLPKYHRIQMQQQCMVGRSERVLFTASDGEGDDRHCWFYPDADLAREILAGWKQFDIDLAAYVPSEIVEMPKAEVTLALPALFIHAKGEITTSNMKEYGEALTEKLKSVRAIQLLNDQDFSNAKESAKLLRENIESAKLAKDAMLAQTVTVGEAARMIDAWCEDMRLTALQLEKDVEREDRTKKAAMIAATKEAYDAHILALNTEIAPLRLPITPPAFAEALKNKRNYASMQDALNTALANGKILADEMAKQIRAKTAWYDKAADGFTNLFADLQVLIQKPMDDFQLAVTTRVNQQKATNDRLAQEATDRATASAAQKVLDDAAAAAKLVEVAAAPAPAPAPVASVTETVQNIVRAATPPAVATAPAPVVATSSPAPDPAAADAWHSAESMPKAPDQWIQVQEVSLYRFLPYKTNSTEYKRGKKGRWQRHNGYGFENSEPPVGQWRIGEEVAAAEAA